MSTVTPTSESPERRLRQVGVRPLSAVVKLGLLIYLVAASALVLNAELVGERFKSWSEALTGSGEFASLASSTGVLVGWAPLLACVPALVWLQGRFGGAEWGPWGLRVVDLFTGHAGTFLPWQLVETLKEVPGGLKATPKREAGRLFRLGAPCLVVPPGSEREELLRATAPFVGQPFEPEVFGVGPPRGEWLLIAFVLVIYLPVGVFVGLDQADSSWGTSADGLSMAFLLAASVSFCALAFAALLSRSTRVELYQGGGRTPLLRVDRAPISFDELRSVAQSGGTFWFETAGGSRLARIHDPVEAERLVSAIQDLGLEVSGSLSWRARPEIRVPLLWSLAIAALGFGLVPALWAYLVPARRAARVSDELGQDLLVVWEESSHRPLLLLALPPDAGLEVRGLRGAYGLPEAPQRWGKEEGLLIDLEAGLWRDRLSGASGSLALVGSATVASSTSHTQVSWDASDRAETLARLGPYFRDAELELMISDSVARICFRTGQARSGKAFRASPNLPATYAKLLGHQEGLLGDLLAGRSSRRIYDLRWVTPHEDLVAAVAWGRVLWAVLIPRDSNQSLSGGGITYEIGNGGNLVQLSPGLWRVDVGGALTRLRAAAPSLPELLRAEERLSLGSPKDEGLLNELLAAPGQPASE